MPMDPAHVAAAIERHIEQEEERAKGYDRAARIVRDLNEHWRRTMQRVQKGEYHDEGLRKIYKEITGVIIIGD